VGNYTLAPREIVDALRPWNHLSPGRLDTESVASVVEMIKHLRAEVLRLRSENELLRILVQSESERR
jgi:hypothetical protein